MRNAIFSGSFDPLTIAHEWIIKEASKLFDKVLVVISFNPDKNYLFNADERLEIMYESLIVNNSQGVSYTVTDDSATLVDIAKNKVNINYLVRGIRSNDFAYEYNMAKVNKDLSELKSIDLETVCFFSPLKYNHISSSLVKYMMKLNNLDYVKTMVNNIVLNKLKEKMRY